jgi:hypothetical protein
MPGVQAVPQRLRHCVTIREVAGLRPDEVTVSIYLILPVALGPGVYSASDGNEYQKHKNNFSGEYRAAGQWNEDLTAIYEPTVGTTLDPQHLTTLLVSTA